MFHFFDTVLQYIFPRERRAKRVARLELPSVLENVSLATLVCGDVSITSPLPYKNKLVQDLIGALKYENDRRSAELLAETLRDTLLETISEELPFAQQTPLLIPVPLSKEREEARGYNQVTRVAEALLKNLAGEILLETSALVRIRDTVSQTSLKRQARMRNVEGAFAVTDPKKIHGRICILLDDVVTTGSTLTEAARTLKRAGAESVLCIACAYA